ncbi:unnamed protein product [Calypogeia fissa]
MSDFSCREAGRRGPVSGASGPSDDRAGKWRLGRMATRAGRVRDKGVELRGQRGARARFWGEEEIMKTGLKYVLALLGHPPTAPGREKMETGRVRREAGKSEVVEETHTCGIDRSGRPRSPFSSS